MLSLRVAARTTRALPRLATSSSVLRALPVARASINTYTPALSSKISYLPRLTSSFSTSAIRAAQTSGEVDAELSAKLDTEAQFEDEMAKEEQMPSSVKDFLSNSPFKIVDKEGTQEVKLVREFGDEKITVAFSISEVPFEDQYPEEDSAYDDAEEEGAPRNQASESENPEEMAEEDTLPERAPPVQFTITIEKPGKTPAVLTAECTAQDGEVVVDYVNHFSSAAEAFASTPEASHARVEKYSGPSFATLDEDLQVLLENYLDERGVTQGLAVFVPDYVEFKEQKEYMRWLKNMKSFVDA